MLIDQQSSNRTQSPARWSSHLTGFAAIALLLLCGCSSFNSDWRRVAKQPSSQDSIAGRWEGRWVSDVNAHTGTLRCIITAETNGICQARFRATYRKILSYSYTVPLKVEQRGDVWIFSGEEDLGAMAGGIYRYQGTATATNFHSTYDSKYDHGLFEMRRP
jgi:hypothetical protein